VEGFFARCTASFRLASAITRTRKNHLVERLFSLRGDENFLPLGFMWRRETPFVERRSARCLASFLCTCDLIARARQKGSCGEAKIIWWRGSARGDVPVSTVRALSATSRNTLVERRSAAKGLFSPGDRTKENLSLPSPATRGQERRACIRATSLAGFPWRGIRYTRGRQPMR
jgi:hypothetical protein